MRPRCQCRRGNTTLEFTLVGIPLVFVLISIFEISRGMWIYHTLEYGIKQGTRYAAVHGQNCAASPNACTATIGSITSVILANGAGLMPADLQLTFCSPPLGDNTTCGAGVAGYHTCSGNTCSSDGLVWPPNGTNRVGFDDVVIVGHYPFGTVLALVWPGAHSPAMGSGVPTLSLPAQARERIEF
jgi:Flp pilus assembly protein TadG